MIMIYVVIENYYDYTAIKLTSDRKIAENWYSDIGSESSKCLIQTSQIENLRFCIGEEFEVDNGVILAEEGCL